MADYKIGSTRTDPRGIGTAGGDVTVSFVCKSRAERITATYTVDPPYVLLPGGTSSTSEDIAVSTRYKRYDSKNLRIRCGGNCEEESFCFLSVRIKDQGAGGTGKGEDTAITILRLLSG